VVLIQNRLRESASPDSSYASFRVYLDRVFTYTGTMSLGCEAELVSPGSPVLPDDFLLQPGSPGHAMLVMDVAAHEETGERICLPAQSVHIVKNQGDAALSPWYRWNASNTVRTPDWQFLSGSLFRFGHP
jgi:hypothetical protein